MQTFPECHFLFVFLTSPPLSLLASKFLCTSRHQSPHFDAPVLPLFIFISPSSSSLSFRPSIHLFQLLGGRALRLFVHAPLPPPVLCGGESYGVFERESAFHSALYVITFPPVCGMYSLWSSLKFLRSVRRTAAAEGRRGRGTRGRAVTEPLVFIYIPPSHVSPDTLPSKRCTVFISISSRMLFQTADSPRLLHTFSLLS